jgi:hypothetical protein
MNAKTLALDQYNRGRRRLNTRLGLLIVALIPLPAMLLHERFEPLQMLATVVVLALGVGIVYPVWWRSKHHPYREDGREKRARELRWSAEPRHLFRLSEPWSAGSLGARPARGSR